MRDIKRIDTIMDKFKEVWLLYPDLRFGQLVENIISFSKPNLVSQNDRIVWAEAFEIILWNWEESNWEEAIKKFKERNEQNEK